MIYTVSVTGDISAFRAGLGDDTSVNELSMLTVPSTWRSIAFIAGVMACSPKRVVDQNGNVVEHPLNEMLNYRVNPWTNASIGWTTFFTHVLTTGNGLMRLGFINGKRVMTNVTPTDWEMRVAAESDGYFEEGEPMYKIGSSTLKYSQVFHIKNISWDGYSGLSFAQLARRTIQAAINAETLAERFLKDGFLLAGFIEVDMPLNEKQLETMQSYLDNYRGLDNSGDVPILPFGAKFKPVTPSATDAQLLETRQFLVEECSRWWGVPQHLLSKLTGGGYNSLSQIGSEVVRYVLRFWIDQTDEEATNKLLTDEERAGTAEDYDGKKLRIESDLTEIERGDWEKAVSAAAQLGTAGIANDNEARSWVGLPKRPGGEVFRDPSYAQREKTVGGSAVDQQGGNAPESQPEPPADKETTDTPDASHASQSAPLDAITVLRPVLDAAVLRIETKAEKALSKPLGMPQANVFADQQAGYVVSELGSVNLSLQSLGHDGFDVGKAASRYAAAIRHQASSGEPASLRGIVEGMING